MSLFASTTQIIGMSCYHGTGCIRRFSSNRQFFRGMGRQTGAMTAVLSRLWLDVDPDEARDFKGQHWMISRSSIHRSFFLAPVRLLLVTRKCYWTKFTVGGNQTDFNSLLNSTQSGKIMSHYQSYFWAVHKRMTLFTLE